METALIHVLISLVVGGLIFWAVNYILALLPIPAPFPRIIQVVLAVIFLIWLVKLLLPLLGYSATF